MSKIQESSADLPLVLSTAINNRLKDLHTCLPGVIVEFDPVTQIASVQPSIRRVIKEVVGNSANFTLVDLPLLIEVPVIFQRGGGYSMTFPIQTGDECEIRFVERGMDNWFIQGGTQDPVAKRFHALSDAICVVGLSSQPNVIPDFDPDSVQLKKDDGSASITISDAGITLDTSNTVTINAASAEINSNVVINGTMTASDVITDDVASVNNHGHMGSATAPNGPVSDTGAPL